VIRSTLGAGTEFILSLPLTLAIIQAIMIKSGDRVFALPLGSVTEVFSSEEVEIDSVEGGPVIRLRDGRVAPLHNLDYLIGVGGDPAARPGPGESVVLVEYADQARALTVREMAGRQEVVVKPLSRLFKDLRGLSGATVLGDGRVAFILDPRMMFGMGEGRS
jgi:two-component system, chemotaxis family, sensor kinase CheA